MDSWDKDLNEAHTKLHSYMQSTQIHSDGKGTKKWKLQSHFFYEHYPILSCLDEDEVPSVMKTKCPASHIKLRAFLTPPVTLSTLWDWAQGLFCY